MKLSQLFAVFVKLKSESLNHQEKKQNSDAEF